jgi:type I restriction enzyme M protein
MIVDSGTAGKLLGRVTMTTSVHEGAVGNNNLIRVVIEDRMLRDYIYEFLRSELGQRLLLRNVYGTNQDHIEPDDVKNIHIPLPRDLLMLEMISKKVRESIEFRERAVLHGAEAEYELARLMRNALDVNAPAAE